MKLKYLLSLMGVCLVVNSANALIIFEDDFESYAVSSSINGQGGWTATGYTITQLGDPNNLTKAVLSPNNVADAAISHAFTEQTGATIYMGAYVDFRPGTANTFFMNLSDDADRDNSAGANFLSTGVKARLFGDSTNGQGTLSTYGDPTRLVLAISVSGSNGSNYDTVNIYTLADNYATVISSYTFNTNTAALDTFFGARGSDTNGNSFAMDNLVIATTFNEAAMIPEPSSMLLMAGGVVLLSLLRWRKRC